MAPTQSNARGRLCVAALCVAVLALAGNCTLGPLQALLFHFTVDEAVEAGATSEIHKAFYPVAVALRKHYVRISGHLDTQGATPPDSVTLTIAGEDQDTGKSNQKVTLKMSVKADGSFTATKRIKKDIPAGTVQTISAEPRGGGIPAGSEIWACIDIAKKKGDLAPASDCHGGNTGDTPTADVRIVEIQDDAFDPKTLRISAGTTVRWVLRGSRNNHTTTELESSSWDSGKIFLQEGDFFEHTFGANTDGRIFLYYCSTHRDCCEMQGSVLVGSTGSPPPGY